MQTLATMLSNVSLTQHGPIQLVMFDIHALQVRRDFADRNEIAKMILLLERFDFSRMDLESLAIICSSLDPMIDSSRRRLPDLTHHSCCRSAFTSSAVSFRGLCEYIYFIIEP